VIDTWAEDRATPASPDRPFPTPQPAARTGAPAGSDGTDLLRQLTLAACLQTLDAQGRPLFTTATWFDSKAPRSFALGRTGVRRLGRTILVNIVIALAALIVAIADLTYLVPIATVLVIAAARGKSVSTRWVDGFENLPDD